MESNGPFDHAAARALDTAVAQGAQYADVRFEVARAERIEVRNGVVAALADSTSDGFGIRALVDGAWGFAACREAGDDESRCHRRSCRIARAGGRCRRAPAYRKAHRSTPTSTASSRRCSAIPQTCRSATASRCCSRPNAGCTPPPTSPSDARGSTLWRTDKYFYSTIGSRIVQRILQTGAGLEAMAVGERRRADAFVSGRRRPLPIAAAGRSSKRRRCSTARRVSAKRRSQLLRAPQCPSGTFDVILGGSQMSLQIHESCGHPAELDRVMGWEANFSGTIVSRNRAARTSCNTDPAPSRSSSTTRSPAAWRPAATTTKARSCGRSDIVRDGVLAGYEMSNDTARAIGRESNACVRAQSWEFVPMIRMCNLSLLAGQRSVRRSLRRRPRRHLHGEQPFVVDRRPAAELSVRLRNRVGSEERQARTHAQEPDLRRHDAAFWNSCDAVADEASWFAWGTPNCGKGEPMQTGRTTQASAPARFRNVSVGVGYDG